MNDDTSGTVGAGGASGSAGPGLLIIGASQAGVQLAVSLRGLDYDAPITLLGDENHRPYQRPALSKEFLQGTADKEQLIFRTNEFWQTEGIELVKGERIVEIERVDPAPAPDARGVVRGIARSASGREFPYERLALAVGARARTLTIPGADLPGVMALRNADDALALKAAADDATDVVVIGGGFIGLEAASSLHAMGKKVTVLEYAPRLIGRAVGPETADFFLRAHRERGLDVRLDARMSRIVSETGADGTERAAAVELETGERIPAQIVLVGIGVIPNTELGEQLGLEIDNGIVVDEFALASDGETVVVGDVANIPNPIPGSPKGERIRLESVNNAVEHAKVAAYSIMGRREEYAGIPWFWSNQADLKLQIAGLSAGWDRTVLRENPDKGAFTVLYYRGDQIIAADCINAPVDFMAVRGALTKGGNIPADAAADPAQPLKKLTVLPGDDAAAEPALANKEATS